MQSAGWWAGRSLCWHVPSLHPYHCRCRVGAGRCHENGRPEGSPAEARGRGGYRPRTGGEMKTGCHPAAVRFHDNGACRGRILSHVRDSLRAGGSVSDSTQKTCGADPQRGWWPFPNQVMPSLKFTGLSQEHFIRNVNSVPEGNSAQTRRGEIFKELDGARSIFSSRSNMWSSKRQPGDSRSGSQDAPADLVQVRLRGADSRLPFHRPKGLRRHMGHSPASRRRSLRHQDSAPFGKVPRQGY